MYKIGLIVNPIAGMGGRVGLKGTDGLDIVEKAKDLGAFPQAPLKTKKALEMFLLLKNKISILTYSSKMGEDIASELGLNVKVLGEPKGSFSTSEDTIDAAKKILELNADILLFAGGDGTARCIYKAVKDEMPVVGIPAGVKIHSAVFAITPKRAGELALMYLTGKINKLKEAEVMDIDEKLFREGRVSAKLYGYLKVPYEKTRVQNVKAGTPVSDEYYQEAIAHQITENMKSDVLYIIGPGTTTRSIMKNLNIDYSLLGVDVVCNRKLLAKDVTEKELLRLVKDKKSKIIVTPIGGQGYIFGRGNQQISPEVIDAVGIDNIIVVATKNKLNSFELDPLLVDTGDEELNERFRGYVEVIIGYEEKAIYPVVD